MRVGTLLSLPNEFSRYGRIKDNDGTAYTVDPSVIPEDADVDDSFAYKVEIWENDSGLVYKLEES